MVYTDGKCYSFKNGEKVGKFTGINGSKYYKNGVEQSVAAGTEVTDNGKRFKYSNKEWIALTGKGNDNCFYVKGVKANGIHEFDNVYYSCKNGKGTKLEGIQKTSGKYYHFSKGIKGDAVDGIILIESKYYVFDEGTKGGAADGIKKLDGYYYKFSDGAIATLRGWNGKHYYNKQYQIIYKKDENLVYKWSKSKWELFTGTLAGVEYEDGAEKTDNDTPGDSENPSDKDEEKLTEGEFRTSGGKLQKCIAELYSGSLGGDYFERDGKYYTLAWRDYTGEYESKFYEAGKHVDYKLYGANGKLYTGWCRLNNPSNWEYAKWIHAIDEKQYPNLLYVENGVVKQYYVYEGCEDHSWCNGCGADMEVSPYWSSAGVNPALDDHKEKDHPQFDHQSFNGGPVYKYTNNGKTYWVTNPHSNYYRWNTKLNKYVEHYIDKEDYSGRVCVDSEASDRFNSDLTKFYVVYSASDWKVGQSSVIVVENDIVLK